jgi:hypothetical protein
MGRFFCSHCKVTHEDKQNCACPFGGLCGCEICKQVRENPPRRGITEFGRVCMKVVQKHRTEMV